MFSTSLTRGGGCVEPAAPTSEADAFDAFVRARMPALLRFAHALTGDPHTAADLVQDALEKTGVRWSRLDKYGDPEAYVRRAIVNGRTSRWRKHRRETLVDVVPDRVIDLNSPHPSATMRVYPDGASERAEHDELWRLLASLPTRQRAVLVLRYYEDLSEDQIAATLGCAPGTVKSQASKGLAKLRAALQPPGQPVGCTEETTWTS